MFNVLKKYKRSKAFTLIELVVVMAVIAILAGVSVGAYFGITNNANESATEQFAKQAQDLFTIKSVSDNKKFSSLDDMAADFISNDLDENGLDKTQVNYVMLDKGEGEAQDVLFVFNSSKWVCSVYDGRQFSELSDYYSSFEDMANDFAKMEILEGYDVGTLIAVEDKEGLLNFYQYGDSYLRKAIKVTYSDTDYFVPNGQTLIKTVSLVPELASVEDASNVYERQYYDSSNKAIDVKKRKFSSFGASDSLKIDDSSAYVYNDLNNITIASAPLSDGASSLNLSSGTYQFMVTGVSTERYELSHNYYAKDFNEFNSLLSKNGNNSIPHDIYVGTDAKIEKDLSLPSGTSIKLGWNVSDFNSGFSAAYVDPSKPTSGSCIVSKLTIAKEASVTITDGVLNVSSRVLAHDNDSELTKNTLVFDYDGTAASKLIIEGELHFVNSTFDARGLVSCQDSHSKKPSVFLDRTSDINLLLNIYNFGGGNATYVWSKNHVFPFTKYGFFGYSVPLEMDAGANLIGTAYLNLGSLGSLKSLSITLVGGSNYPAQEPPVLIMRSGKTDVYWEETTIVGETHDRLVFHFSGEMDDGAYSKKVASIATIDATIDYHTPFAFYNMGIIIEGSGLFDDVQMKVLPGSYVKVIKGAEITIKKKALFYPSFKFAESTAATYNIENAPAAYLEVPENGTYTINFKSEFGGLIKGPETEPVDGSSVASLIEDYGTVGIDCFTEIKKFPSMFGLLNKGVYTPGEKILAKWQSLVD